MYKIKPSKIPKKNNSSYNFKNRKNNLDSYSKSKNPEIFKNRYNRFFGNKSYEKLIKAQRELSNNQFIRINESKISIDEVKDFLLKNRVKFSETFIPNFLKIERSFFNLSSSLLALTGKIYIQDLASGIPISTIDLNKLKQLNTEVKILDVGASPGSKTTQLADILEFNKIPYHITCIEPNKLRITKLINNLQRQNIKNVEILNLSGEEFKSTVVFDLIILDVPCSGNLIDDKNWLNKRDLKGITKNAELQKKLLKNISKLLSKNGELIYSTCSLEPEENELNIDWSIKHLNLKTTKIKTEFPFKTKPLEFIDTKNLKDKNAIRIIPYESKTQGFFICKFINK